VLGDDCLHEHFASNWIRDVELHGLSAANTLGRLRSAGQIEVGHDDVKSSLAERGGNCGANTRSAAGHCCN
jgi:hypothetical protein